MVGGEEWLEGFENLVGCPRGICMESRSWTVQELGLEAGSSYCGQHLLTYSGTSPSSQPHLSCCLPREDLPNSPS